MAHDPNKKQRLSDFDFSSPDAHVAIVGKAANGKEKFLVVKKLNADQEPVIKAVDAWTQNYIDNLIEESEEAAEREEKADKVYVEMPLEKLLTMFLHTWGDQAQEIAASVVMKSITDDKKDALRKALIAKLQPGSNLSGAADQEGGKTPIEKSEVNDMSDQAPEQVDVQKALAARDAEVAELRKSLDALKAKEEAAELAKFVDVAKGLKVLGATEELGKVLKAVAAIEGGVAVIDMLKGAADTISKASKLEEVGSGMSVDAEDKPSKLAGIAKGLATDKNITFAQAMVMAADLHPELVA